MLIVIDNYDSFTYNLVQYFGELGEEPTVFRNDKITVSDIQKLNPNFIVISPGPGRPADAGISEEVIKKLGPKIPLLGVCLGHQGIGEVFGATVTYAPNLMHGKVSEIFHDAKTIFKKIPMPFEAARYHSLAIDSKTLGKDIVKSAWTHDGVVMGVRHVKYPIEGIQFHPESILTKFGKSLLKNFLEHFQ